MRRLCLLRKPTPVFSLCPHIRGRSCSEAWIIFFFRRYPIARSLRRTVSIPTGRFNFSTISNRVMSGCSSTALAMFSKSSCPSMRLRPLSLTRRSTLPVLPFCSASRYTLGTDTPYANTIPLASCVLANSALHYVASCSPRCYFTTFLALLLFQRIALI